MTESTYPPTNFALSAEDIHLVLSLRLLIARAANRDSLAWWEDDSLAGHSAFILDRIFPVAPLLAARSLALRAALARHQTACAAEPQALHLFHLDSDSQDGLALRQAVLASLSVPEEPIRTIGALQAELIRLGGEPRPYKQVRRTGNQAMLIEIPSPPAGTSVWRQRAQTLAWAYLEGAQGQPVFPFLLE